MAIKIVVSNRVKFRVEGTLKDEEGKDQPFNFGLLCDRIDADTLKEKTQGEVNLVDFMADITRDWFDVKAEDGKPLAFSEEALRQLFQISGLAWTAYRTYLNESGAKAKN